ncbi:MAG: hypothetical protein FWD01_04100 [Defluviitaleaceae bacterium]|nr:hypothetical protein [Defluviitaleaceae bacterium]
MDTTVKILAAAIYNGRVNHAYIISGAAKSGKTELAKSFARAILCRNQNQNKSNNYSLQYCGSCAACISFEGGNNPDVVYVVPAKTAIGVDDIRQQVNSGISVMPYGKHRIYIIEAADHMTHSAQNALLKTLEEGNTFGIFILTATNPEKFLPTILSRCIICKLKSPDIKTTIPYTETEKQNEIINFIDRIFRDCSIAEIFEFARHMEQKENKENINQIFDIFALCFRDLIILKQTAEPTRIIQKDMINRFADLIPCLDTSRILNCIEALEKARWRLFQNANFLLTVEVMLLEFCGK